MSHLTYVILLSPQAKWYVLIWIFKYLTPLTCLKRFWAKDLFQNHIFLVVDLDPDSLVALVQYLYTGQLGRPLSLDSCPSYLKILQALGDVKFIKDEII